LNIFIEGTILRRKEYSGPSR